MIKKTRGRKPGKAKQEAIESASALGMSNSNVTAKSKINVKFASSPDLPIKVILNQSKS